MGTRFLGAALRGLCERLAGSAALSPFSRLLDCFLRNRGHTAEKRWEGPWPGACRPVSPHSRDNLGRPCASSLLGPRPSLCLGRDPDFPGADRHGPHQRDLHR